MARKKRQEMSGLFDFFKKKPEKKSLLEHLIPFGPSLPSQNLPAQKEEQRSLFAILRPQSQLPAPAEPRKPSFFSILAPTEQRQAVPPAPSKPMVRFPEAQEEKGEVKDIFKEVLKTPPQERRPSRYVFINPSIPPQTAQVRPYGLPAPAAAPVMEWTLPTPSQMAERFKKTMNLPAMWDEIRAIRAMPEFKADQLAYYRHGAPMVVPLDPVVYQEFFTDFANFYGIPWNVMLVYLDVPAAQIKQAEEALWNNVLSPLNAMLPEAFEILKPVDLPGFFNVSWTDPNGEYWLNYIEALIQGFNLPGGSGGS
jgi:hypothetical protein